MIPGRRLALIAITETYKKLQVPLFASIGGKVSSFSSCDDPDLFLYVPFLSYLFDVDAWQGAQLFTWSIDALLFISFFVMIFSLTQSFIARFFSCLLVCALVFKLGNVFDVYIAFPAVFIPLNLFLVSYKKKYKKMLYGTVFLLGFVGQAMSLVRGYALLAPFCFFITLLFGLSWLSKKQKGIAILCLLMGTSIPKIHYLYALSIKQQHMLSLGRKSLIESRHVFWHNIYIGFGFTRNNYEIQWDDSCAFNAIKKNNPKSVVGSKEGEALTKQLVLDLYKKDRHFVLTSLFARFGVIVMFFLVWFGWLGVLCSYFYPKTGYEESAFLVGLGINALPGIITLPCFQYITGFIVCTVLYVVYSLINACNQGLYNDLKRFYEKNFFYYSSL